MRCEAEHCDGKSLPPRKAGGTHSPKELLRRRVGALPEPWSRFARHGSPGMTRFVSHTSTKAGTRERALSFHAPPNRFIVSPARKDFSCLVFLAPGKRAGWETLFSRS